MQSSCKLEDLAKPMPDTPAHRGYVVEFPQRSPGSHRLTASDRQDVAAFRGTAEIAGYDALIIHVVSVGKSAGMVDYVAAYRAGEPWSAWCFTRSNDMICCWDALTSQDHGSFPSMSEALGCILLRAPPLHAYAIPLSEDRPAASVPQKSA